jgi:hypothetical protein
LFGRSAQHSGFRNITVLLGRGGLIYYVTADGAATAHGGIRKCRGRGWSCLANGAGSACEQPGKRTGRLSGNAFCGKSSGEIMFASTQRSLDQSQIDNVALCVAATETVCAAAHGPDQCHDFSIPPVAECLDRACQRVADIARKAGIVVIPQDGLALWRQHGVRQIAATVADTAGAGYPADFAELGRGKLCGISEALWLAGATTAGVRQG